MNKDDLLTAEELAVLYGPSCRTAKGMLDRDSVPSALRPLVPYAEFWGISDDVERERFVQSASPESLENLVAVVRAYEEELDKWLAGPEANSPPPTREYVAFSAMRMAADFV